MLWEELWAFPSEMRLEQRLTIRGGFYGLCGKWAFNEFMCWRTEEEVDVSSEGLCTVMRVKHSSPSFPILASQDKPCIMSPKGWNLWLLPNTSLVCPNTGWILFHNRKSTSICVRMHDKFHLEQQHKSHTEMRSKSEHKAFICSLRKNYFFMTLNHEPCCRKKNEF